MGITSHLINFVLHHHHHHQQVYSSFHIGIQRSEEWIQSDILEIFSRLSAIDQHLFTTKTFYLIWKQD